MNCDQVPLLELIRGELSPGKAAEVRAHLERCRTCRERVTVMAVLETHPEICRRGKPLLGRYLAAAALVVVVLGGLLTFQYMAQNEGERGLTRLATLSPYPYVPLETRGAEQPPATARVPADAFREYERGNFAEAARLLRELPLSSDNCFYLGVSLYLAGNPGEARRYLERALSLSERWRSPALWYLANADLREGRLEPAMTRLEEVQGLGGEFALESRELLGRLNRFRR